MVINRKRSLVFHSSREFLFTLTKQRPSTTSGCVCIQYCHKKEINIGVALPSTVLDDIKETQMDIATGSAGRLLSASRYSDVVFCFPPKTEENKQSQWTLKCGKNTSWSKTGFLSWLDSEQTLTSVLCTITSNTRLKHVIDISCIFGFCLSDSSLAAFEQNAPNKYRKIFGLPWRFSHTAAPEINFWKAVFTPEIIYHDFVQYSVWGCQQAFTQDGRLKQWHWSSGQTASLIYSVVWATNS